MGQNLKSFFEMLSFLSSTMFCSGSHETLTGGKFLLPFIFVFFISLLWINFCSRGKSQVKEIFIGILTNKSFREKL